MTDTSTVSFLITIKVPIMGCTATEEDRPKQLKVATLNYSGILLSPYEFYETYDEKERNLSSSMKRAFDQQIEKQTFRFKFGPFDREWQQNRYSPIYRPECGIKNNIHLMSGPQFRDEWDRWKNEKETYGKLQSSYNTHVAGLMKKIKDNPSKAQEILPIEDYLKNLKMFDFMIYKTLLEDIYSDKKEERDEIEKNFEIPEKFQLESKKYKQNRKKKFQKAFLNEEQKIKKTIEAIKSLGIDIFFIQEASPYFIEVVEKLEGTYRIVKSNKPNSNDLLSSSVILIRESKIKFSKLRSLLEENTRLTNNINWLQKPGIKPKYFEEKDLKSLNFNSDTVVQCLYNLILVCPHLSSNKQNNEVQIKQLKKSLANLKESFPSCHIITAGDLNCKSLEPFDESIVLADQADMQASSDKKVKTHHFNVVPNCKTHITANKIRTSIQAQPSKADEHNFETKDYIISDLEIRNAQIRKIDGSVIIDCDKQTTKIDEKKLLLLPSDDHPYDHYLVTATIVIKDELEHVTDPYYRFKYKPEDLTNDELENIHEYERKAKQEMNK